MPIQSDVNNLNAPFPVVDADPHFSRVLRNLRTQDYLLWGGATAFAPGALYGMGASSISSPCRRRAHELTSLLVLPPRRARRPDQDGPCPHALVVEARDLARLRWRLPPRVPERVACVASSSSPLPPPPESAADLLPPPSPCTSSLSIFPRRSSHVGLEGELCRAGAGQGRAEPARQGGQALVRRERPARVHPGRRAPQLDVEPAQVWRHALVQLRQVRPAPSLPPSSLLVFPPRPPCADAHALRAATPSTVPTRPSTRSKLCLVEIATM